LGGKSGGSDQSAQGAGTNSSQEVLQKAKEVALEFATSKLK